jgi:hypothetical protein
MLWEFLWDATSSLLSALVIVEHCTYCTVHTSYLKYYNNTTQHIVPYIRILFNMNINNEILDWKVSQFSTYIMHCTLTNYLKTLCLSRKECINILFHFSWEIWLTAVWPIILTLWWHFIFLEMFQASVGAENKYTV